MNGFLFLLALLLLPLAPAMAQEDDSVTVKDSVYFTLDDGVETPEEMLEEAEYVYGLCTGNAYENLYFDCKCLSGAFLQIREKAGPTLLQSDILTDLTKSSKAMCANTAQIAGQAYKDCQLYANGMRELASDAENENFCTCAANKSAEEFAKAPRLSIRYIRAIKTRALSWCEHPENRKPATTSR